MEMPHEFEMVVSQVSHLDGRVVAVTLSDAANLRTYVTEGSIETAQLKLHNMAFPADAIKPLTRYRVTLVALGGV